MRSPGRFQRGMTLIEVLISLLILAIGLLGAAAIQLNALKYTDSSTKTSQASFIAYDMMDRIRANVDGNASNNGANDVLSTYSLASLSSAPSAGDMTNARTQDLYDFRQNVRAFGGDTATGKIEVAKPVVTITITWSDARAENKAATQTFTLSSRIGVDAVASQ